MKWSNEKPTKDGCYWFVEKRYIDGGLLPYYDGNNNDGLNEFSRGPSIVYFSLCVDENPEAFIFGDDCPIEIDDMVKEWKGLKDIDFTFDNEKLAYVDTGVMVIRRREYWFSYIPEPDEMP